MPSRPDGRGPGRPRVLSEADIVDAALSLAREHGILRLSMRAVARKLGVPPMTIYGYVPNKAALDALVIDRVLSEIEIPGPEHGTWEVRLRDLLCDARRILIERPHFTDGNAELRGTAVQLLHRGAFGREATRLADGVFDLLRQGGFRADALDTCFVALFTYVTGYAVSASSDLFADPRAAGTARTGSEMFALGLEALIEGLKLRLHRGEAR